MLAPIDGHPGRRRPRISRYPICCMRAFSGDIFHLLRLPPILLLIKLPKVLGKLLLRCSQLSPFHAGEGVHGCYYGVEAVV